MVLVLCTYPDDVLYLYQVLWKYLKGFQNYWANTISIVKFSKGNNSIKHVDGVKALTLCISSDHALYLYKVSWINLQKFSRCGADMKCYLLNFDLQVWPWPLSDIVEIWLLHIVLTRQIFDPSFKIVFQEDEKIWSGHERLTDGQIDRQTSNGWTDGWMAWHNTIRLRRAYKNWKARKILTHTTWKNFTWSVRLSLYLKSI